MILASLGVCFIEVSLGRLGFNCFNIDHFECNFFDVCGFDTNSQCDLLSPVC